ncbi:alcohol dehydrogenase family protein [Marinobacterium sp. AK62]|uniref:Alcohol dehydrogenase family protein n=1 Tax=Marinobacterium alkalitolerans TaxID=1542925 RepID=A0ABS3Z8L5_9GAMM|nr:alcohol dehydrogenase family protein [Marinobacterium alkalitolerans]MBP0047608.1 alcohol dehydrogenase family protein [Marinobacterium alkalitolerans]
MSVLNIPDTMAGVLLTGHGGLEQLEYREDLPVPRPLAGQVLIKVGASAINNTDINTRIGWYSRSVSSGTDAAGGAGLEAASVEDAAWSGSAFQFPRIQGLDCCGTIVAVGEGVDPGRVGERVLVRPMHEPSATSAPFELITFGSDYDGAFAEYAVAPAREVFPVQSSLTDEQLASFPCAYSTAESMLERADVKAGDRVLVTGASGGVGSAAVQLAKRRGAEVVAVCSESKGDTVLALGADTLVPRGQSVLDALGENSVQVVVDLVGRPDWPELLDVLQRGGRYVVSGAIAGPVVELDLRTLYLKNLTFYGSTWQPRYVFEQLVQYIERGEVKPQVARVYPLSEIRTAQQDFVGKTMPGKLVLTVPRR